MSANKKVRVIAAVAFTCLMTGILISSLRKNKLKDEFDEGDYNESLAARVRKKYNIPNASRANDFVKLRSDPAGSRYSLDDESGILL